MLRTYKYKLYPTKKQKQKLKETTFLCSLVYNQCLAERKEGWEKEKKSISYLHQQNSLPKLREKDNRYKEIYSQVLQDVVKKVDKSYQAFFRRIKLSEIPGYPRFKSARRYDSFTYPQSGFQLQENKLILSKIGHVKIKVHREIKGKVKTLTIRRQADGWFACFSCEVNSEPLPQIGKSVGVDVGLENFAITSDGEFFPPIKDLRKAEWKIKYFQREVSRRKKGSNRRRKSVWRLKNAHLRVFNKRKDTHHKVARSLVNKNDLIAIEDLTINNMIKNHHLAKSISDAGWSSFANILTAKVEETGRKLVKVDPKFTSQTCSECGVVKKKPLSQRWHSCECGCELHRDVNAAKNIITKAWKGLSGMGND